MASLVIASKIISTVFNVVIYLGETTVDTLAKVVVDHHATSLIRKPVVQPMIALHARLAVLGASVAALDERYYLWGQPQQQVYLAGS